jgi:uncharacterized protein YbjT (DUF2867 family)
LSARHVVTGAFGYSGKYIARLLLARGDKVTTLTGHPDRQGELQGGVEALAFNFDRPDLLAKSLEGAEWFFNTYWVRFSYGANTHERAIANTRVMIDAAVRARIRRFIHVSITNASEQSRLPYFRGKGEIERMIIESGLSYAIVRPTVVFGPEDILINNIAWLLRKFPVFAIPGSGDYRLQPVFVEDMAELAIDAAARTDNQILDAVGPEIVSFNELVAAIAKAVGSRAAILHLPPAVAWTLSRIVGMMTGDVMLTKDEVAGLMAELLMSGSPPTCRTRLSEWMVANADRIGRNYASELARHYR